MDWETARIYRTRLRGIRARLRDDVTQLAFAPDCEMTMQLWTQKEEVLRKIETALGLIENGTYGQCQRCGRRIPKARLTAVPYTDLCTACANGILNPSKSSQPDEVDDWPASAAPRKPSCRPSAGMRNPKEPVCGKSLRPGARDGRRGKKVG